MFGLDESDKAHRVGFILVPDFSMMAFASATEPLRLANRASGETLFSCESYSLDGKPVTASNGVTVEVDKPLSEAGRPHTLFVCAGVDVEKQATPELMNLIRRYSSHGASIGSLCTGTYILAKAGLLDGYRCTMHWENLPAFREEFPDIEASLELFEIDRSRYTCAGGTAALDMMLTMIVFQGETALASEVAEMMIHHHIRESKEGQRMDLRSRLGITHPKLLKVIELMEENVEEPIGSTELAQMVGMSSRQLERLFRKYLNYAPTRYYLELRLNRSRFLLLQTSMSVLSVALACGFISASHFSKCYREHFKRTPSEERRPQLPGKSQSSAPGEDKAPLD